MNKAEVCSDFVVCTKTMRKQFLSENSRLGEKGFKGNCQYKDDRATRLH